jgi:hypothetical protein
MQDLRNGAGSFMADTCGKARRGTNANAFRYFGRLERGEAGGRHGSGLLLWLLGIPIPVIILIWVLGGLYG